MILDDRNILAEIVNLAKAIKTFSNIKCEYPLDIEILERLDKICAVKDIYRHYDEIFELWSTLIEKAIKCLKYHDKREPFLDSNSKIPVVYGMDKLKDYFTKYSDFEGLLYGADKYYRDHVFHAFRTWATGVYFLLTENMALLKAMKTDGVKLSNFNISELELISMWTVAALCHDLGYPLEKARYILAKTKDMTQSIVGESEIWADMSFSGIQEEINLMILKFMSSKMMEGAASEKQDEPIYKMRVQPKYYIKLCKSLEKHAHGVLSTIVLIKSLVYFMESEFGVNEDGDFNRGDHKQFYIKREILRAIAFHTCSDIYHMSASSLPFLLLLCDEVQNWDRRNWKAHYTGQQNETLIEIQEISSTKISFSEKLEMKNYDHILDFIVRIQQDFEKLKIILRDGIDTIKRDFDFYKTVTIKIQNKIRVEISLKIPKNSRAVLIFSAIDIGKRTLNGKIINAKENQFHFKLLEEGKYMIESR